MKPEEMIAAVEALTHEQFEPEIWLQWFNEGLRDLAPVLFLETLESFSITNATSRELPGDIFSIKRLVLENNGEETPLVRTEIGNDEKIPDAYWVWDNMVFFPKPVTGTLKLWYYRYPAKLTLGSASADIPERYLDAVILYAAAKSKAPDRWLTDKSDFYRDYLVRKQQIEQERRGQIRVQRRIRVPPWSTFSGRWMRW